MKERTKLYVTEQMEEANAVPADSILSDSICYPKLLSTQMYPLSIDN